MSDAIASWREEKQSAWLYRVLVEAEPAHADLFAKLAAEADEQAGIWAASAAAAGRPLPTFTPEPRARLVAALVRRLGARRLRGVLAGMKVRGMSIFKGGVPSSHPMPDSVDDVGARHRSAASGGNLRAAVFGVNDGLVSNASLILGVAGAAAEPATILLAGVAGLLAGAFSMAAGEYVSVRSQRELLEYQLGLERKELAEYPAEEATELALIYAARGVPYDEAHKLATRIISDPESALQTLAREELGLDPDELGSPWGAALSSFLSFAAGAVLPLLPFLLLPGPRALPVAIGLTAAALFGVGASLSLFVGRGALRGGLRMLLIGGAAGAATWLIGGLLGVSLA